jgi:hypothetical protein
MIILYKPHICSEDDSGTDLALSSKTCDIDKHINGVSREKAHESSSRRLKVDLESRLPQASRKERAEIQQKLKTIAFGDYNVLNDYSKGFNGKTSFYDLNRTLIGIVYPLVEPTDDEVRFNTTSVRNLGLTFEKSKAYKELIRVTAFLTKTGTNGLRNYLDRRFLKRQIEKQQGFERRIYDLNFDGIHVHVNLRGKIEIYAESDCLKGNLIGFSDDLTRRERCYLVAYARFSDYKKWPRHTNNAINSAVAEVFNQLSVAVDELTA